ncbi:MAG: hybrid sensor histidine kinase/response regulator [Nitrospinae bacterium]|nr:hybrid sensor histidine kinase/response regulator [Nitrospinota bacterium]
MDIRAVVHYAFAAAMISLYGGRVCYLVDTLNILTWTKFLALVFIGAFIARSLLWQRFVGKAPPDAKPMHGFLVDFSMSLAISAFITIYNSSMYGFGAHSGMKVMVGVVAFGFFIAVDSALDEERKLLRESAATGKELGAANKFISLPVRFAIVGTTTIVLVVTIVYLFFARDLLLVGEGPFDDYNAMTGRMSSGLMLLCAVVLAEVVNMVISYSRTMRMHFRHHTAVLLAVAEGDFDQRVPVATKDEFGLMARYTNLMIDTLRSRTSEKQTAEDATKLKDQFVSLVAHDLRSPFNAILGFLKLAARDEQTPLSPKHKELVGRAITNSEMLVKTIDHLLDISRLQTGKMQVEPRFVSPRDLAQTGMDQLAGLAEKKGIAFINSIPASTRLFADPVLIGEIFINLFSNSVKFCKTGDTITAYAPPDAPLAFAVRDTGIGIPNEVLPDLFKPEVKTTSSGTAGEQGTGLGLPFCADIMRAHNGEISVSSEPGWGTVFMLRFPVVEPVVLLCLNGHPPRQALVESLRASGIRAVEAASPDEARWLAVEHTPHLAVIDTDNAAFGGLELLRSLRSDGRTAPLRVLAVTVSDSLQTKMAVLSLKVVGIVDGRGGADEMLKKIIRLI